MTEYNHGDPEIIMGADGEWIRANMSRMFMVFRPDSQPIYWTASRRALHAVQTFCFREGDLWEVYVEQGYTLRKLFYRPMNITARTKAKDWFKHSKRATA